MRKMSAVSAKKRVDELRKKFNLELLKILEEEQSQESLREHQLRSCSNPQEAAQLEERFGIERAKAS